MGSGYIHVVAALALREGRVLLCQRPAHKEHGGQWEMPACKVEPGEDLKAAATRLLARELGVKVTYVALPVWKQDYPERTLRIVFAPVEFEGEPHNLAHSALQWTTPQEALQLRLATLVRTFVETILIKQTDNTMA
jgi:ADP-ribose pyrophosphatase YjhB (NUDIX family)